MKKLLLKTMLLLFALIAGSSSVWAQSTITFSDLGLENGVQYPDPFDGGDFTVTFTGGGNDGKYYTTGSGIRVYGGGNMTITAKSGKIAAITITYDGSNKPTSDDVVNVGDYNCTTDSWSGDAASVVFTRPSVSGHWRVKSITVTMASGGGTPTCATPTFSPASGTVLSSAEIAINCATTDATIYYTTDGTDPTTSSSVYSDPIPVSATIKAFAVKAGSDDSEVATANYTIIPAISGYNVNFESELFAYTDWTITNLTKTDETISANTGDYFAKTNGTTTASVQTKEKVSNPGTFTCYVSKQTNNKTSSTWYIQVSEDGSEWTNVKAQDATSMDKGVWVEFTADLTSYSDVYVRLYYNGSTAVRNVDDIVLTEATPSSVATPSFSVATGTYTEIKTVEISCATAGATIYYTLDGSTPTSSSTPYTGALTIDATTTVKAIAIKDAESSSVASATYTIELPLATIAEVKALNSGDNFTLNLTGAQIVYFDGGKNMYIRDASGAILFYNSSSFSTTLVTGDILSGIVTGKYQPYNGLPEVTNSDISGLSKTSNSTVVAKSIAGTTAAIEANLCDLVKIENTEISESDSKYYVGTSSNIQLYNQFKIGGSVNALTFTTGQPVDVSGIATVYNTTYELFPRFESDIVYLSSAEEVAIGAAGIATFCSEHALDFTGTDAIAVYTAAASGNRVILTQIHKVPANTGVILMNALGMNKGAVAAVNVPYLDGDAEDVSDNELVGITTATVVNATVDGKYNYILSNEDAGVGFYKAVNGVQLAANKAYLSTTVNAAVRDFLGFTEDDSDAIIEIAKNEKMSAIYDLSGRRVVKPTKGLYIVNGKKVVK